MSFLNSNNGEVVSAKITKNGRKAIASGSFNIAYFQVGDSEFDYSNSVSGLTGLTTHQYVMSPFDKDSHVKYPLSLDSNTTTTYGIPALNPNYNTSVIRNLMGPAGCVSNFASGSLTGTTIESHYEVKALSSITGGTSLTVIFSGSFSINDYITLSLNPLSGSTNIITGNTNSFIYKIVSKTGNTLTLDRNLPNLSSLTTSGVCFNNLYSDEYDMTNPDPNCLPTPISSTSQLNSWTMNTVWSSKPIGSDVSGTDENLIGYNSNRYSSAKNYFGYTNLSGQTFQNLTGGTITGTTFTNGFGDLIEVKPEEQRCVAILHYSELGDLMYDPERFFKYDDYISDLTGITGTSIAIAEDYDGDDMSDNDYFEIFIPFIYYHRSPNKADSKGARFFMDETDYYIKNYSGVTESNFSLKFRYLLDESDNKVGKVFVNNKIIVIDDQELVAILDYRSNRKYTLPAPKARLVPTGDSAANSLLGNTDTTLWVTYMITNGDGSALNTLPCNYFVKTDGSSTPSNVSLNFDTNNFQFLKNTFSGITNGFVGKNFYVLTQTTTGSTLPSPNLWRYINYTINVGGDGTSYLQASGITGTTITITKSAYDGAASNLFDLENHMSGLTSNYLGISGATDYSVLTPQFGDAQPFPGSIRLVRASDVEEFNYLVNLPSGKFNKSQNPTYTSGQDIYITEVSLLDNNKKPLVVAKTPTPIKRVGAQVFSVRLDF